MNWCSSTITMVRLSSIEPYNAFTDNKGWELVERAKLRADEMAEALQDNFVFTMGEEAPPAEDPKK